MSSAPLPDASRPSHQGESPRGHAASDAATEPTLSTVSSYLRTQLDAILAGEQKLAEGADWTYPIRVAVRRTRSTLRTFAGLFETSERRHLDHELRWWAGLLGEVRDRRVQISWLTDLRGSFGDDTDAAAAIGYLTEILEQQRSDALGTVLRELPADRHRRLTVLLAQWYAPPFMPDLSANADEVVAAVDSTHLAFSRALAQARRPDASHIDVHEARKAGKRYRYALELATPRLGIDGQQALERARALQDELGHYQDSVVGVGLVTELGHARGLPAQVSRGIHDVVESMRASGERAKAAALALPL